MHAPTVTPSRAGRIAAATFFVFLAGVAAVLTLTLTTIVAIEIAGGVGTFPRKLLEERHDSVRLFARDGSLLREATTNPRGHARWVGLADVAPVLLQALLAAEDARYRQHHGIDYDAMVRAVGYTLAGRRSGGSTLSQQVVKLLRPRPRTLASKLNEMIMALRLERVASKDEILEQYVNRAPFGAHAAGIEAASLSFFGKPARELSLAEAALLAALPKGPTYYDPRRHAGRALGRRNWVLGRMRTLGLIDEATRVAAAAEPLRVQRAEAPFRAPHFTARVLRSRHHSDAPQVTTTLDGPLQRRAEVLVTRTLAGLRDRGVSQAAALVLENATGDVLAYVGSADFHEPLEGQVDAVHARRQPGSALKPFAYALAFEQGLATPASLLLDLPAHFTTASGEYSPRNYDNRFHGPVLAREALANSYNVPAVRLAHALSPGVLLARLHALGFDGLTADEDHYGLGLVLGNGEVSLWELARAYLALARGGQRMEPRVVLREGDSHAATPTFSPESAYLVTHILSDAHARQAAFGERSALDLPFPAAVKTGTSTDFRDNWTAGFTSEVTVVVWVGNFSGKPMRQVSGVTGAAPLWNELVLSAMERRPHRGFARPAQLATAHVCAHSGALAGRHCQGARLEWFIAGTVPTERCRVHVEVELDRANGLLAGPACAAKDRVRRVGERWPAELESWAVDAGRALLPRQESPRCPPNGLTSSARELRIQIRAPRDGEVLTLLPDLPRRAQRLPLEALVQGAPRRLRWFVDGRQVSAPEFPYRARWQLEPGRGRRHRRCGG